MEVYLESFNAYAFNHLVNLEYLGMKKSFEQDRQINTEKHEVHYSFSCYILISFTYVYVPKSRCLYSVMNWAEQISNGEIRTPRLKKTRACVQWNTLPCYISTFDSKFWCII